MVDHMLPAVLPQRLISRHITDTAGCLIQQGSGSHRFGLHPEILVVVTPTAVRRETIDQTAMLMIPGLLIGAVKQCAGAVQHPGFVFVPVQNKQQLGPFRLMARLETPGAVQVFRIVFVVLSVDLEIRRVMLPDQTVGQIGLTHRDIFRQGRSTVQKQRIATSFKRGQHRFT